MVKVARSVDEVKSLASAWEKLQWHPNAAFQYFLQLLESDGGIERPHVVALFEDESPKAILAGRVETFPLRIKVGYKRVCEPLVRSVSINYGGVMGDVAPPYCDALIQELTDCVRQKEVDIVFMNHLRVDSALYQAAIKVPGFMCRDHFPSYTVHWQMVLPSNIDEVYQALSGKRRHELRRRERQFLKDFSGEVKIDVLDNNANIAEILNHIEAVASKTYHRSLGVGFVNDARTRQRVLALSRLGWLRSYILYVGGNPCAFWIGTRFGSTFYLDYTGYDPSYKAYEPGVFLFMKMVENLCEIGIKEVDFGFGDAFYKQRFGNKSWEEASVYIFSPTLRGLALNSMKTVSAAVSEVASTILGKIKVLDKVKRTWRNGLREKGNNAQ
jgi:hypothetical protein